MILLFIIYISDSYLNSTNLLLKNNNKTGQKRGSGTNSKVFVTLRGTKGTSPKLALSKKFVQY